MPDQPKTPARTIRVPEGDWAEFLAATKRNDTTASEVLRRAVVNYNRRNK